jgi:hypothetical protein
MDDAARARTASFLRLRTCDHASLPAEDLLGAMHARRLDGLVVRGVFTAAEMDRVVERLETRTPGAARCALSDDDTAYSLGRMLLMSSSVERYLEQVDELEAYVRSLFEGLPDFRERVWHLLSTLCAERLATPTDAEGRPYAFAAVRCVPPGAELPTHCEKEQQNKPVYGAMNAKLDDVTLLSYYVALSPADAASRLVVYDLRVDGALPRLTREKKETVRRAIEARYPYQPIAVEQGDLVLFDGGRFYHRVTPVQGPRPRWTLGGFLGFSSDARQVYVWA